MAPAGSRPSASPYVSVTAFVAGAVSMATEMAAPRILAPQFGMSQGVWALVIGAVLVALMAGAFVGGRLADRYPNERAYAFALASGGLLVALVPSLYSLIAPTHLPGDAGEMVSFGVALAGACVLLMPGVAVLGMMAPWAIRLSGQDGLALGRVAGRLGALAAAGSVLGTFLGGLVMVPLMGTRATFAALGGVAVLSGAARQRPIVAFLLLACWALAAALGARAPDPGPDVVAAVETQYQSARIIDVADGRALVFNEGAGWQSYARGSSPYTGGYWDHLAVLGEVVSEPGRPLRVLLLGLAGGTVATLIEHRYADSRELRIDGVELDPGVTELARAHLGLADRSFLSVHSGDARAFLQSHGNRYDLVVVDAYQGFSPPFHLLTREFFDVVSDRLHPGGAMAINLASPSPETPLTKAVSRTLHASFPHVYRFVTGHPAERIRNVILVAAIYEASPPPVQAADPAARALAEINDRWTEVVREESSDVLTDDHAPVEWLSLRTIIEAATQPN